MWVGIALLIELAAIMLWKRWYWFFPTHAVSGVYTKYAGTDGLNVVFLKDFQVNDTLFVDVTLLEAKTDSAWVVLQSDFHVPIIPEEYRELLANSSSVDFWLASKKDPTIRTDTIISHNDLIVMSRQKQTISVCHIENKRQADAIMDKKTNELSKSKNTKQ